MRRGGAKRNIAPLEDYPTEPGNADAHKSGQHPAMRNSAMLTVLSGARAGMILPLETDETTLGRGSTCQLQVDDGGLSRRHCVILRRDQRYVLRDLKSRNGTWVQGERVDNERELRDGDRIALGHNVLLKFSVADDLEARVARRVYEQTVRDPLTVLYNRRYFDERLVAEVSYGARHTSSLALLLCDVDHFKQVNDVHGHPAGDGVLRAIADRLRTATRIEDVVARYGGEEFAILARGIDLRGATVFAERIRTCIAREPLRWEGGTVRVTVSIGVALFDPNNVRAANELLSASDEALYQAKNAGRNKVVTAALAPITSSR